jgi:hypothetical protein
MIHANSRFASTYSLILLFKYNLVIYRFSTISGSVIRVLVICECTPLRPFHVGPYVNYNNIYTYDRTNFAIKITIEQYYYSINVS